MKEEYCKHFNETGIGEPLTPPLKFLISNHLMLFLLGLFSAVFCLSLFRSDLDEILLNKKDASTTKDIELINSIDVYFATCRFLSLFRDNLSEYNDRLEHLCRYLLASLESENPRHSYIGVALNKELSIAWIRHIKLLLYKCCVCMEKLKPGAYPFASYILLPRCLLCESNHSFSYSQRPIRRA